MYRKGAGALLYSLLSILSNSGEHKGGVRPSKAEAVREGNIYRLFLCMQRNEVESGIDVRRMQVGRGRNGVLVLVSPDTWSKSIKKVVAHLGNGQDGENGLDGASSSKQMSNGALRAAHCDVGLVFNAFLAQHQRPDGSGLRSVAYESPCGVSVDVVNHAWFDGRILECPLHGEDSAGTICPRRSHMMGIAAAAIAPEFGKDVGSPSFRMLQLLQHHHSCALGHDEPVAIFVEGAAAQGGLMVISRR